MNMKGSFKVHMTRSGNGDNTVHKNIENLTKTSVPLLSGQPKASLANHISGTRWQYSHRENMPCLYDMDFFFLSRPLIQCSNISQRNTSGTCWRSGFKPYRISLFIWRSACRAQHCIHGRPCVDVRKIL